MEETIYYLETDSTDPFYNLAFEEYVLSKRTEGSYLMLWQNDKTVVVGLNQNTEAEINRSFIKEQGVKVVRRSTGGGAVYHDLGNLNYSFITDAGDTENLTMSRFVLPVIEALRALGLNAEASGRNDILVEGKKISGTAQRLLRGRILHHGTLLFRSDVDTIAAALKPDPEKFASKSTKSVRSRVANISDYLPAGIGLTEFWDYLKKALSDSNITEVSLKEDELDCVKKLRDEKYMTWEWNYGRSPKFDFSNKRRHSGGSLEVMLSVSEGIIRDIAFYGDFLGLCPIFGLQNALIGCRYERSAFKAVLEKFDLSLFFGRITADEVLNTAFGD